jgi:hypothetical protein
MDVLGYMFEVSRMPLPTSLDYADTVFLQQIGGHLTSAYKIWNWNRKHSPDSGLDMAYKNVHGRIQRLLKMQLISEIVVSQGFKHGAKNYRPTTRGLVYLYSILWGPKSSPIFPQKIALLNKDNILFQTFLFPYFEFKTLANTTQTLELLIESFITGCCQTTVACSALLPDYIEVQLKKVKSKFDLLGIPPMNFMHYKLSSDILMFIVKCSLSLKEFENWEHYESYQDGGRDYHLALDLSSMDKSSHLSDNRSLTSALLAKDIKFMKALQRAHELVVPSFDILRKQ